MPSSLPLDASLSSVAHAQAPARRRHPGTGRALHWRYGGSATLACAAGVVLGCSDKAEVICAPGAQECSQSQGLTGEADAGAPEVEPAPRAYLVGTRIFDDTTTTSYFHVLPGLGADVTFDLQQALEVPGSAKLYSAYDLGWFAIGSGEAPIITRYELDAAGTLVPGQSMSLLGQGVTDLWDTLYFVSPTKAYYPDRPGGQLIVWNPSTMEVTGTVPLPDTLRPGYLALYGYAPIVRGNELLISVGWFDWDVTDSALPETGVVVLDTTTDSVVRFDTDTRCGGVTQPITLPSGDAYLVSSALAGAAHRLGRLDTAPCALRIPAGSNQLDPDYSLSLEGVTGSNLAGEPVPAGDYVFLRAFDDTLATMEGPMATWELTSQAAWRWLRWDPSASEPAQLSDMTPSTADVSWFQVDGRVYGSETTPDYSQTTLIELSAEGPIRALTAPGFLHGVARVR